MRSLFFIFLFYSALLAASPVEVSVDRSLINLNESFDITFSTNKAPDKNPNFTPLEKNFEIINKNHGSTMSWVNGKRFVKIEWVLTVIAKKAGKLIIPTINFGRVKSPTVSIRVSKDSSSFIGTANPPIFVEVEATPTTPYVQSQVIYTLRFFSRVNIAETQLTPLNLSDAVIEKLGEDKHYKIERDSISYSVTERNYAIFPQKSGSITIPSLNLTAVVLMNRSSQMNRLFGAQNTRRMNIKSKAITLDVQSIPSDFKGKDWLAANKITLQQTWSGDKRGITVGEPLTRTLILRAEGLTKGQLPLLQRPSVEKDLKNYPDQPILKEARSDTGIIATREEKIAFIPAKNGDYILPEITIDWFNLKTGKIETLVLPRTTITAIGELKKTTPPPVSSRETLASNENSAHQKTKKKVLSERKNKDWIWPALSVFFAIGWGVTLWKFFQKRVPVDNADEIVQKMGLKAYKKYLIAACNENDRKLAKDALLGWGALHDYDTSSLGSLALFCHPDLRDEILVLNQNLYSKNPEEWEGELLLKAFNRHKISKNAPKKKAEDMLEPLYRI